MSEDVKKPAFTPGPWFAEGGFSRPCVVIDDAVRDGIACPGSGGAMSYTETVCVMTWTGGEHDANAHLIAAAPDLYETLFNLLQEAVRHFPNDRPNGPCDKAIDAARAALRKAEGGTT